MPKMKTHKGLKKRFKVSATGKVSHKRCGSSHLNSHKSGKRIRKLRRQKTLKVSAEAKRVRGALLANPGVNPQDVAARKQVAVAEKAAEHAGAAHTASPAPAEGESSREAK